MGHLGVTEVLLALGLVGLIFAETIVRRFTRWVARTPDVEQRAPHRLGVASDSMRERAAPDGESPSDGAADAEKVPAAGADAGP